MTDPRQPDARQPDARQLDVHRLAVLREVARAGSFAGASAALRHTPSAVSQQIAALERGAGTLRSSERSTRGVTLTDAGLVLLATADAIHAELQPGRPAAARPAGRGRARRP